MSNKKPAANGHAATMNGQELGLANELALLNCIKNEGWVREYEASLITDMSQYTVGVVSRRLATRNQIYRSREAGNAGYFLRLKAAGAERVDGKSGKDIVIPASWPHHAMSIQTLNFLAADKNCGYETEASVRHRQLPGKIPDGKLVNIASKYHFEQERTRKSGKAMQHQAEHIVGLANTGTQCHIAYPYPAEICGGIDHELRQRNAIRPFWGDCNTRLIKLVRCHFDSLMAYKNMHISRFEIINLPALGDTDTPDRYLQNTTNRFVGFSWDMTEQRQDDGTRHIQAILRLDHEIQFQGVFIENDDCDGHHHLNDASGNKISEVLTDFMRFDKFVRQEQNEIVHNIEGELIMDGMQ